MEEHGPAHPPSDTALNPLDVDDGRHIEFTDEYRIEFSWVSKFKLRVPGHYHDEQWKLCGCHIRFT